MEQVVLLLTAQHCSTWLREKQIMLFLSLHIVNEHRSQSPYECQESSQEAVEMAP